MIERGGDVVIRMLDNVQQMTIEPLIKVSTAPGTCMYEAACVFAFLCVSSYMRNPRKWRKALLHSLIELLSPDPHRAPGIQ